LGSPSGSRKGTAGAGGEEQRREGWATRRAAADLLGTLGATLPLPLIGPYVPEVLPYLLESRYDKVRPPIRPLKKLTQPVEFLI
jgi:hypothetical protein